MDLGLDLYSESLMQSALSNMRRMGGGKYCDLTLFSPSGARGSVIHDPNLDPEVFIVTGSLIPVSFPQAVK